MLPFLKPKTMSGVIMSTRKQDGGQEEKGTDGEEDQGLIACAEDLIRAIHSKDAKHVALALRAAFDVLESEPHPESDEHTSPNTYEAQNIKAGE